MIFTSESLLSQYHKWNKRLFKLYWVFFLITASIAAGTILFDKLKLTPSSAPYNLIYVVILHAVLFSILLASNLIYSKAARHWAPVKQACFVMSIYVTICAFLIVINYFNTQLYVILIGPCILSVLYLDKKVIVYSCATSVIVYLLALIGVSTFSEVEIHSMIIYDIFVPVTVFIACGLVARLLLSRVHEAMEIAQSLAHEKEILNRELLRDQFTKLFNHTAFYERLDEHIQDFKHNKSIFSLIVIDIDDFKKVNDTFGHDMGDVVLLGVVDAINSEMSEGDSAYRYGGEEFVVLCRKPLEYTVELAERIRKHVESNIYQSPLNKNVTISLGVCEYDNSFGGRREFFAAADKVLYDAKHSGKNKTLFVKSSG